MALQEQDIKRVKGQGFLLNRGTEEFSGRIITENGVLTAAQMQLSERSSGKVRQRQDHFHFPSDRGAAWHRL